MENVRELAVDSLLEIMEKDQYSHLIMKAVLDKYNYMEGRDKALLKRLVEGTLENRLRLDYVLDQFSKVPVSKMKPFIRTLLRMSVYQLLFLDSIPDRAVCNEAVKLAGKRGFRNLQGFVNGVLRTIGREKGEIRFPDPEKTPNQYLSVRYSMPEWIVHKFCEELGYDKTETVLASFQKPAPVTIRLNPNLTKEEADAYIEKLCHAGAELLQHPYLPYAYRVEHTEGLANLPGYQEGMFAVQDVSSMLVCVAAGIQKDDYVIDLCAAPGGKAGHAALLLNGSGRVSARDLTDYKADLIRENKERLKLNNMEALVWDACVLREEDIEKADVVLADLPCSGLGIMGRKADIRYHASKEGLDELAQLQRQILKNAALYVKCGGSMIYSTCTINRAENEENVRWFLEKYPFELESMEEVLPEPLKEEGKSGMLQLLPGIHETDGFFLAKLRKKG